MKFSKLLPCLCALAVGASGLTARAEDNPAQAAARVALAKKLFEMDAQKPPATNRRGQTGYRHAAEHGTQPVWRHQAFRRPRLERQQCRRRTTATAH